MKTTLLLLLAAASASAASDRLLSAIAQAESRGLHTAVGDYGTALSAYQVRPDAWIDANRFRAKQGLPPISRTDWTAPAQAKAIASAYCDLLAERLTKAGVQATPQNIYAAYTCGFASFRDANYIIDNLPQVKQNGIARFNRFYR